MRNGNSGHVIANMKVEYSQLSKTAEEARRSLYWYSFVVVLWRRRSRGNTIIHS